MSHAGHAAAAIFRKAAGKKRLIIAIAGPPAAGKTTLAASLRELLGEEETVSVPMDGFHYDDVILERRSLQSRKGSPETFDFGGLRSLLVRIRALEDNIAIPVFDRELELSRAGAEIVDASTRFVLVEGNYLLLDEAPWSGLAPYFDFTIRLEVEPEELERRLTDRWQLHGKTLEEGQDWIASNDRPNIDHVIAHSRAADLTIHVT